MNKLWQFDDYVNRLTHENLIVRRWAFNALKYRYPKKYAAQASCLLNDENDYMICDVLRYFSNHNAIDQAPVIIEKFQSGQGIIASNSTISLARMQYEPAIDGQGGAGTKIYQWPGQAFYRSKCSKRLLRQEGAWPAGRIP